MSDSEPIECEDGPSDLMPVATAALSRIPAKMLSIIMVIYLFLHSDVFVGRCLSKINGAVGYGGITTTKGTICTAIILILCIVVVDLLIRGGIV